MRGQRFALLDRRRTWGEERVYYHDAKGQLRRICVQWTSLAEMDLFVQTSAGRSSLRVSDLLQLVALIAQLKATLKPARSKRAGPKSVK